MLKNNNLLQQLQSAWSGGKTDAFEGLVEQNLGHIKDDMRGPLGRSVVWWAAAVGSVRSITLLTRNGCNANSPDVSGWSPLHAAVFWQHPEAVSELIKTGAVVDATDQYGQTPLMRAADGDHKIVAILLKAGANVNHADGDKRTALMIASNKRHPEVVRMLLLAKANPDLQDKDGITALMRSGNKEICQMLLDNGADAELKDREGKDARARLEDRAEILQIIQNHKRKKLAQTL